MNISHFLFIVSDNLVGDRVRKTNGEDTMSHGKQKHYKSCQTEMDHASTGSSQYQMLQEKSRVISTELVSNAVVGILS